MKEFWLTFVPLFVAVDAVGLLPIYLGLTEGFSRTDQRRILGQSLLTALAVALLFLYGGKALFDLLGVTIADFMIAGGTLLFVIALTDIVSTGELHRASDPEMVAAVPLGVPLLVGPAVLTTIVLLADQYGAAVTVAAVVANLAIAGGVLFFSQALSRILGRNGVRIFSKVANLILAAIAVHMVRLGVGQVLAEFGLRAR